MLLGYISHFNIGIFYKDLQWRDYIFERIKNEALECETLKYYGKNKICFSDHYINIYIHFCTTDERARGRRFDRIYYQEGIDEDIVLRVIRPLLISKTFPLDVYDDEEERNNGSED